MVLSRFAESRFAESRFAESRFAESHFAESRFAESRFAESRFTESRFAESRFAESRFAESQRFWPEEISSAGYFGLCRNLRYLRQKTPHFSRNSVGPWGGGGEEVGEGRGGRNWNKI